MTDYVCLYCNGKVQDLPEHYKNCNQRDSMKLQSDRKIKPSNLELDLKTAVRVNRKPRVYAID